MEQKNTIIKCKAHPNCLFNYNGVCDNYVISIGKDGKCDCYIETATCQYCEFYEDKKLLQNKCLKDKHYYLRTAPACDSFQEKTERDQRAECNFYENVCDYEPFLTKAICSQCRYDTHGNLCSRKNVAPNGIWTCWEKKE